MPVAHKARRLAAVALLALIVCLAGAVGEVSASSTVALQTTSAAEMTSQELFREAERLFQDGQLEPAANRLRELLSRPEGESDNDLSWRPAARVRLGDIGVRLGSLSLAAAEYARVLEEESASPWLARARLGLASLLLAQRQWLDAADLLQRLVVEPGAGEEIESSTKAMARAWLTLIHRIELISGEGRAAWTRARELRVAALTLERPVAVAAAADGRLIVVDEGLPLVALVEADRRTVSRLTYSEHRRPWWGLDGTAYLSTRKVGVQPYGGLALGFLEVRDDRRLPLKELRAVARGAGGRWYLLDTDPPRVLVFSDAVEFQGVVAARPQREPVDLATDSAGRLFVLDGEASAVWRYGEDGTDQGVSVRGSWRRPVAIDVDMLGNLYVLDRDSRTVEVYRPNGELLERLGPQFPGGLQLREPRDLAVDGSGRLYIADRRLGSVVLVE